MLRPPPSWAFLRCRGGSSPRGGCWMGTAGEDEALRDPTGYPNELRAVADGVLETLGLRFLSSPPYPQPRAPQTSDRILGALPGRSGLSGQVRGSHSPGTGAIPDSARWPWVWAPVRGCCLRDWRLWWSLQGSLGLSPPMANFLQVFLIQPGEGDLLGAVSACRLDLGVSERLGRDSEGSCVLSPACEALVEGEGEPKAVGGAVGENAEYVTDKELVLELNKGARTYVINAINTVI